MINRVFSLVLALVTVLYIVLPVDAFAATTEDIFVLQDAEKNERIDQLFAMRLQLETDYVSNQAAINRIDMELASLGVETISHTEVAEKLGYSAAPRYSVSSTSTTEWTSRRSSAMYNGILYELQIIEGVPTSGDSPLRENYSDISYSAAGFQAGMLSAIEILSVNALTSVPVIGDTVSIGLTFYDLYEAINDSMTTSSTIDGVEGVALISFTGHMKYIFVKRAGAADIGNQILCYSGNSINFVVSVVSTIDYYDGSQLITYHDVAANQTYSTESQYYSSGYYNLATKNYHEYKTYNIDFTHHYLVSNVELKIFNQTNRYSVPYEYPPLSY